MIQDLAIATGADAKYFPLLQRCLTSIRAKAAPVPPIHVFDVGLEPAQRDTIRPLVADIIEPGWDFEFAGRAEAPGYYRAQTVRPFLPRYLPDHRVLMWIDADAFLQDSSSSFARPRAACSRSCPSSTAATATCSTPTTSSGA
jgi:hypothetical protein